MNVLQCHSCAQTLDRGERCIGPEVIRKGFIAGHFFFFFFFFFFVFVEHIYKYFLSVLS